MTEIDPSVLRLREAAVASGLVPAKAWNAAVRQSGGDAASAGRIATSLVAAEVLTTYQAEQLLQGRTKLSLGMYTIVDFIGQGGMGQVFLGTHRWMGRRCAIKVLPLEKTTEDSRESFLREMRIQATLDCPYLVRAFDAGVDGRVHYLVTEYVPGTDLRRLVKSTGPLAMDQAASVIAQAAAGLAYAHGSGLIHRDIKPANLLVDPGGRTKVSDVGLAMLGDDDNDPRAGKIVGTADYLSPEQIRTPESVGPASDLYSLGCTLYYAVTGKVPYPGGDAKSKCHRHLHEQAWNPRKFNAELSDDFIDAIGMLMEKDPARRPRDATEVVHRMKAWTGGRIHGDGPAVLDTTHRNPPGAFSNLQPPGDRQPDRQPVAEPDDRLVLEALSMAAIDFDVVASDAAAGLGGPFGAFAAGPSDVDEAAASTATASPTHHGNRFATPRDSEVISRSASATHSDVIPRATLIPPPPPPVKSAADWGVITRGALIAAWATGVVLGAAGMWWWTR